MTPLNYVGRIVSQMKWQRERERVKANWSKGKSRINDKRMEKHECEKLVKPIILSQWAILCAINTRSTQYSNNNNYNKLSRMTGPNRTAAYFLTCAKRNIHTLKKINMNNLKMIKNTVKQKKAYEKNIWNAMERNDRKL